MKKEQIFQAMQAALTSGQRVKLDAPPSLLRAIKDRLRNRKGRLLSDRVEFVPDAVGGCIWVQALPGEKAGESVVDAFQAMTGAVGGDLDKAVRDFYNSAVRDGYFETAEPVNVRRVRDVLDYWNAEFTTDVAFRKSAGLNCFYKRSGGDFYKQRQKWAGEK